MSLNKVYAKFEKRLAEVELDIANCPAKAHARRRALMRDAEVWREAMRLLR